MSEDVKPMERDQIERLRRNPHTEWERALLATLDQRDRGISDLTLAIHAERRERQLLQETVERERQWYPFEQDQKVFLCVEETAYGATWHAVFSDQDAALEYADSRVDEEGDQYLDVMSGRMAGLKTWNSFEPMPRQTLPADVVRALRAAAFMACSAYPATFGSAGMFGPDETCAKACDACVVRRAARAGLRAAGIEVEP